MNKNRKRRMKEANAEEDKVIKQLEKRLKLNKRKAKGVPKSFVEDGLDCKIYFTIIYFKSLLFWQSLTLIIIYFFLRFVGLL